MIPASVAFGIATTILGVRGSTPDDSQPFAWRSFAIRAAVTLLAIIASGAAFASVLVSGKSAVGPVGRWVPASLLLPDLRLVCGVVLLAAAFGLSLVWHAPPTHATGLLAAFIVLLGCGYGCFFATESGGGLSTIYTVGAPPETVRNVNALRYFWRVLGPVAWLVAAVLFVRFAMVFPWPLTREQLLSTGGTKTDSVSRFWWRGRSDADLGRLWAALAMSLAVWVAVAPTLPVTWEGPIILTSFTLAGLNFCAGLFHITKAHIERRPGQWFPRVVESPWWQLEGHAGPALWLLLPFAACIEIPMAKVLDGALATVGTLTGVAVFLRYGRRFLAADPRLLWVLATLLGGGAVLVSQERADAVIKLIGPWLIVVLLIGVRCVGLGLVSASGDQRRRALWVVTGLAASAAIALYAVFLLIACSPGSLLCALRYFYWLLFLPLPVLVAFLAVATFYRGELDPALVLRRTCVYGIVSIGLLFAFGFVEHTLTEALGHRLATWVAAGSAAVTIHPIKKVCERGNGSPQNLVRRECGYAMNRVVRRTRSAAGGVVPRARSLALLPPLPDLHQGHACGWRLACPLTGRRSSSSSSTGRLRRPSASRSRNRCCRADKVIHP